MFQKKKRVFGVDSRSNAYSGFSGSSVESAATSHLDTECIKDQLRMELRDELQVAVEQARAEAHAEAWATVLKETCLKSLEEEEARQKAYQEMQQKHDADWQTRLDMLAQMMKDGSWPPK